MPATLLLVGMLACAVWPKTCAQLAGFTVESPEAWQAREDKLALKLSSKDGASVDFWVVESKSPLEEFAAGYIQDYQKGLSQARLGPIRSCKVNGLKIVRAEGIAVMNGSTPFHFTVGVFGDGPRILKFTAVCRSDRYAAQKANLMSILGSVKAQ
jgi:hypothetical protein